MSYQQSGGFSGVRDLHLQAENTSRDQNARKWREIIVHVDVWGPEKEFTENHIGTKKRAPEPKAQREAGRWTLISRGRQGGWEMRGKQGDSSLSKHSASQGVHYTLPTGAPGSPACGFSKTQDQKDYLPRKWEQVSGEGSSGQDPAWQDTMGQRVIYLWITSIAHSGYLALHWRCYRYNSISTPSCHVCSISLSSLQVRKPKHREVK